MAGIDHAIAGLAHGGGVPFALLIALLLGLRHATDPDHLTAVTTLVAGEERRGARRAGGLGAAWGAGHAATLLAAGVPLVLARGSLPAPVERAAEAAIGLVVVALAVRLLVRWRRGYLHVHAHRHGAIRHVHPHVHERTPRAGHPAEHAHAHGERLGRSPLAAFGIGALHGLGGSAGVALLVVGAVPGRAAAAAALVLFAGGTALSMALVSAAFGLAVETDAVARRLARAAPALGMLGVAFGCCYALAAV